MFENEKVDGTVYVPVKPKWIQEGAPFSKVQRYYNALTRFYIVETPVGSLSASSVPLAHYGWQRPWAKPEYLNRKLKDLSSNSQLIFAANNYRAMETAVQKAGLINFSKPEVPHESIAVYNNQNNQFFSIFYHIRNSLCHGRFCFFKYKREYWVALEDVSATKPKGSKAKVARLSARMLLRYRTLLDWVQLIYQGPNNE